ncbi:hypothetical protein BDD12DRAFT_807691 [Trichophaea hybrida]|nr:hypothetical protein BDD12DRAFT_807691 [Trichophaea hybrida]
MAYSMQFASAFIHGFVALESEVDASGLHSRSKRFVATVPVPDFEDQLGSSEHDILTASVSIDNEEASVTAFFPKNTSFYVPGDIVYVCAKFVASTTRNMVLDTTIHHTLNFNVSNPPDPMPCLIHICGHVESVYQVLPEYGDFRGYNVKTACWTKEYNRSVDFVVRVIIAPGVRFNKTSLPQINSLINVHGILFGRDKALGLIIILLKEFSFLHRSSTSDNGSVELGGPPETPRKKGWGRAPPTTPSKVAASPSTSAPSSNPPTIVDTFPSAPAPFAPPPAKVDTSPSASASSAPRTVAKRKRPPHSPMPIRSVSDFSSADAGDLDDVSSATSSLTDPDENYDDRSLEKSFRSDIGEEASSVCAPGGQTVPLTKRLRSTPFRKGT